jgi:hypothetical protein
MKSLLAGVTLGFAVNAAATTLSLDSLQVELAPGWVPSVEKTAPPGSEFGDRVSVRHPDGVGVLYLQTYTAPAAVSDESLRRLTNLPSTEPLVKRQWGEFSGYRHDYVENRLFHRIWWLARDENVVLISYQCGADQRLVEIDQIEEIVGSLTSTLSE